MQEPNYVPRKRISFARPLVALLRKELPLILSTRSALATLRLRRILLISDNQKITLYKIEHRDTEAQRLMAPQIIKNSVSDLFCFSKKVTKTLRETFADSRIICNFAA